MGSNHAVGWHPVLRPSAILFRRHEQFSKVRTPPRGGRKPSWEATHDDIHLSLNWTDEGVRSAKDAPKRSKAARELAQKMGVEIKQIFLTSGDSDLLAIVNSEWR